MHTLSTVKKTCVAFFCALTLLSCKDTAAEPHYQTFALDNGLQVVVFPNHKVPAISHMLWYKVGAKDEPRGKSGIAHFLEHLMFKGTDAVPSGEFSKIVARHGGRDNAFTNHDFTAYHQQVSRDNLELVMRMEADRMQGLTLEEEEVLTERDVIIEERRMRIENNPSGLLAEQMRATLFQNHPYGIPSIGWKHEMATLSRDDALTFYRKYYRPNNAILIVSGDITAEELKPLAEKYYGPIPAGDPVIHTVLHEPEHIAPRRITLTHANVQQPSWMRIYLAPSLYDNTGLTLSSKKPLAYALLVLSDIIGGGQSSRLYQALVVEKKQAVSINCWYDDLQAGPSWLSCGAQPAADIEIATLEQAIDAEIAELIAKGIADAELERAKRQLKIAAIYAREGLQTQGYITGQILTTGGTLSYLDEWDNNIDAVTKGDIQETANKILDIKRSVTGILLPEGAEAQP